MIIDRVKRIFFKRHVPFMILITVNILIGLLFVDDFGDSWDEQPLRQYAEMTLQNYSRLSAVDESEELFRTYHLQYYGPVYITISNLGGRLIGGVASQWSAVVCNHFINFLTYQLGLVIFYFLLIRIVKPISAFITTVFFNTQPLLWGHAFINSKDMPFMVFFLGSIYLGIRMVDAFAADKEKVFPFTCKNIDLQISIRQDSKISTFRSRKKIVWITLSLLLLPILYLLLKSTFQKWISNYVRLMYNSETDSIWGFLFSQFAQNARSIPVESYIQKSIVLFDWIVGLFTGVILLLVILFIYRIYRNTRLAIRKEVISPIISELLFALKNPGLLLAAVGLGLCTSIRVLGPLAGLLVGIYLFWKFKWKAIIPLIVYFCIASLITYAAWPYLWGAPVSKIINAVRVMSQFPYYSSETLFDGVYYAVDNLPGRYLPELMFFQFTEATFILLFVGIVVGIWRVKKQKVDRALFLVISMYFLLPFLLVMITKPVMYDNFRQFLFIIPPIFLIVGLAIDGIIELRIQRWIRTGFVILILLPGIYFIGYLHPYSYTYYNIFAGGIAGSYHRFETDYWATSFKEATEYVNRVAPPGALIVASEPHHIVRYYARQDLEVELYPSGANAADLDADFAIVTTRLEKDTYMYPGAKVIYRVERGGAVYAMVKQVNENMMLDQP